MRLIVVVSSRVIQCAEQDSSVLAVAVEDSILYTTSSDNKIRMWELTSGTGADRDSA